MSVTLDRPAVIDARRVAAVLSEIAEIASETLERREVFPRVAAAVRSVIPFGDMGVVRIIDSERAVLHATTADDAHRDRCSAPMSLTQWSPRWRPRPGRMVRIDDARAE